jgi:prepilin signal peptidase PulO-like enzyme (type II secretory pathway)
MTGVADVLGIAAFVTGAALAAGLAVRRTGKTATSRRRWWAAAVAAAVGAGVAAGGPAPAAGAVGAAGLAAAAVVDATEGRVPTAVAHATTLLSSLALVAHGIGVDDEAAVVRALVLAAVLAAALALLWLAGLAGFGDVRLSGAVVSGLLPGLPALAVVAGVALTTTGLVACAGRVGRSRRMAPTVPFAPGLALGWLVAVAVL